MAETGICLLLLGCLAVAVIAIAIIAVACEPRDSYQEKMRRIKAKEKEAMQGIDQEAEYWVGLYRYIARRVDDESRRRQSG